MTKKIQQIIVLSLQTSISKQVFIFNISSKLSAFLHQLSLQQFFAKDMCCLNKQTCGNQNIKVHFIKNILEGAHQWDIRSNVVKLKFNPLYMQTEGLWNINNGERMKLTETKVYYDFCIGSTMQAELKTETHFSTSKGTGWSE